MGIVLVGIVLAALIWLLYLDHKRHQTVMERLFEFNQRLRQLEYSKSDVKVFDMIEFADAVKQISKDHIEMKSYVSTMVMRLLASYRPRDPKREVTQ